MDSVLQSSSSLEPFYSYTDLPDCPELVRCIRNVLTPIECYSLIQIAEQKGFEQAALYTDHSGANHINTDIRKSSRCIVDSHAFAEQLWSRIQSYVPTEWKNGETVAGINERLRILRYYPGDEFKPHVDGSYMSPTGSLSKLTILIYLNSEYTGGFTTIYGPEGLSPIQPEAGMVVLQDQSILHSVPPLRTGCKYVVRTEVMYRPKPPSETKVKTCFVYADDVDSD